MDIVTRIMVNLGDLCFALMSFFSPLVALVVISALTGVVMLLIWRYTSNQKAIEDVRKKISAHLLATRLFKDDLSVSFAAQRQIVWQAFRLLAHSVRPMLIMTVPFVLIMVQIGLRYEFRPLPPGETVNVVVTMKDGEAIMGLGDQLKLPAAIETDQQDPCRAVALRTIDWRLTPDAAGLFALVFGKDDDEITVPLIVGDGFWRLSRFRGGGFWDRLLYSAEPSIPASSAFESVEINYPSRSTPIFGLDVHWLITLLVLSIIFALLFKPILKVHI